MTAPTLPGLVEPQARCRADEPAILAPGRDLLTHGCLLGWALRAAAALADGHEPDSFPDVFRVEVPDVDRRRIPELSGAPGARRRHSSR